jgi:NAD(P)-dependent dehydrogenase (short-subunit alcohol dehydrogenase family)
VLSHTFVCEADFVVKEPSIMKDDVVLITGALTGIGRAAALAFAGEQAKIMISGRNSDAGRAFLKELRAMDVDADFIRADVREEEEVCALVDATISRFGRLDAAVNNAGTVGDLGLITAQTVQGYASVFDTNVLGTMLCLKYQMRAMFRQGAGSIVNLSSTLGSRGAIGAPLYVASKHAVEGLTRAAALEGAATGVRVNAVAPGPIKTAMLDRFTGNEYRKSVLLGTVPMRRAGRPEEVADMIVFLASSRATYITGQIFAVNGGRTT